MREDDRIDIENELSYVSEKVNRALDDVYDYDDTVIARDLGGLSKIFARLSKKFAKYSTNLQIANTDAKLRRMRDKNPDSFRYTPPRY